MVALLATSVPVPEVSCQPLKVYDVELVDLQLLAAEQVEPDGWVELYSIVASVAPVPALKPLMVLVPVELEQVGTVIEANVSEL